VELTREQREAVEANEHQVFVAAGAGTGKTSLLVARYVRALLEDDLGTEDLPTVTFTRKAAAEMKSRIRADLLEQGRSDLAWSLDAAPIGTIHGLCASLLRAYPLQAGVDPSFVVADEVQASILQEEALDLGWERLVQEADEELMGLLARHQRSIRSDVVGLYLGLRGLGHDMPRFVVPEAAHLDQERGRLAVAGQAALAATAGMTLKATAAGNRTRVQECLAWLPAAQPTWEDLEQVAEFVAHMGCGALKPVFEEWNASLKAFRQTLGMHYLLPLAGLVDRLLTLLGQEYVRRKTELSLLDFNDVEIRALQLLDSGVRPYADAARLMVDEFQDTNGLQCRLIEKLGVATVLTVGDLYQSIYGFRGADVEVFRGQERAACGSASGEALHSRLSMNFRSRRAVLGVINRIFAYPGLFGDGFSHLEAARAGDEPRGGLADERGGLSPAVELVVLDRGAAADGTTTWQENEARVVADLVAGLVREQGWRPRDVVVLLRALTHVHELEEALVAQEVPSYVVQGRGYYDREELGDLLALLRSLVNPHDDMSLVTALRSPLGVVRDDVLYLLRLQADRLGGTSLWEAMREHEVDGAEGEDAERLSLFRERVETLRNRLGAPGLSELIDATVTAFDYDLVLLQSPDGARRYANVRKLMLLADEFEAVEGPDLAGFVRYLVGRRDLTASREGNAALLAEEDDVVRVMTIHQAKGLEFPVVVIAGMGGSVRTNRDTFPLDRSDRVSLRIPGPDDNRFGGPLVIGPADDVLCSLDAAEREEEKRLYYVAMTRAMERLVLVGSLKGSEAEAAPLTLVLDALGVSGADLVEGSAPHPEADLDMSVRCDVPPARLVEHTVFDRPDPPECPASRPALLDTRRRGGGRVSFSSLAEYDRCPRGYYLQRVLGLDRWMDDDWGGGVRPAGALEHESAESLFGASTRDLAVGLEADGRRVGTLVHAALEKLVLGPEPELSEVRAAISDAAAALVGQEPDPVLLERGAVLARAFWRSPYGDLAGRTCGRAEVPFLFSRGDTLVSGAIDLLCEEPERWTVIDYKTNRLGGRPTDAAAAPYGLQAEVYGLACLLAGAPSVTVAFVFLESPDQVVSTTYGPADRPALELRLDGALSGLAGGSFPANPLACSACWLHGLCMV
jgi:ATP-dependent helicase/nuclease subunit A